MSKREIFNKNLFLTFIIFILFLSGCTTQNYETDESNDETENTQTILTGSVESNKTFISIFLGNGSIYGVQCRIKVIDPSSKIYDVDQPAPDMLIPLFLESDNSNSKSQLRVFWTDNDDNNNLSGGDKLDLTSLSEDGLDSGVWYLTVVTKIDKKTVFSSGPVNIP